MKNNAVTIGIIVVAVFFLFVFIVFALYDTGTSPSPALSEYEQELYEQWKWGQYEEPIYYPPYW